MSKHAKLLKESKKLCWEDRLLHKNSKVRYDANIDLKLLCDSITDPKDHRIRELCHLFKKTVSDPHALVQDKALDALIAYLKAADEDVVGRYAKEVCDALMTKCAMVQPETVEKAQIVFMLWVELGAVDAFLDVMDKAVKSQVAKAVLLAIDFTVQALSEFGIDIVRWHRIQNMLLEIFKHQDPHVLASSKRLTHELCRWVGINPIMSELYKKMTDTMKEELNVELRTIKVSVHAPRRLRSAPKLCGFLHLLLHGTYPDPSEESAAETPLGKDELVDHVDFLTLLKKSGFWDKVKSRRWTQRKEALANLSELASTKRIAPGDFTDVCPTLKKLFTDRSILVRVEAVRAIGNLALEIRVTFSRCSLILLPVLLAKFSEKNPIMTDALTNTLEAIHKAGCATLANIRTDVKAAVKSEDPHVCSRTLNWLLYCIKSSSRAVILTVLKDYDRICLELLNDGTPEVRDAAFSVLAAIEKSVGIELLDMPLEKLVDVRRKRLSERRIGFSGGGATKHGIMKQGVSRGRFPKVNMARGLKAVGPCQNKLVDHKEVEPSEMTQLKNAAGKRPLEEINQLQKLSLSDPKEQNKMDVDGEDGDNQLLKSFPPWWNGVNRFEHISPKDMMRAEWCTTCGGLLDDSCWCKRYASLPTMEPPPCLLRTSSRIKILPFKF